MGSEAAVQGELGLLLRGVLGDNCVAALVEEACSLKGEGCYASENLEG